MTRTGLLMRMARTYSTLGRKPIIPRLAQHMIAFDLPGDVKSSIAKGT